jgi:hypothetical protein
MGREYMRSPMQEAAVQLLDAATLSNPPHCCRRTQPTPMSATAELRPDVMIAREVKSSALAAIGLPIDIIRGNNNGFEAGPGWDPMAGRGLLKGDAIAATLSEASVRS